MSRCNQHSHSSHSIKKKKIERNRIVSLIERKTKTNPFQSSIPLNLSTMICVISLVCVYVTVFKEEVQESRIVIRSHLILFVYSIVDFPPPSSTSSSSMSFKFNIFSRISGKRKKWDFQALSLSHLMWFTYDSWELKEIKNRGSKNFFFFCWM